MDGSSVRISNLTAGELSAADQDRLVEGLVQALPALRMRDLFAARRDMFTEADLITTARTPAGELVGVLASRWATLPDGTRFLHVTSQFVAEGHRHGVVFRRSWAEHLTRVSAGPWGFPTINVLKTYNPRVYCAMNSLTAVPGVSFYPVVDGSAPDPRVAGLAARISRVVAPVAAFDAATGVIEGAGVPADLYPELPRSANPSVNDYFARHVRPSDRILCVLLIPQASTDEVLRVFTAPRAKARR